MTAKNPPRKVQHIFGQIRNNLKNMKAKIVIVMISGLLAGSLAVSAQDTPAASATATNTAAQPAAEAQPAATTP
jgi:hypothetical protein